MTGSRRRFVVDGVSSVRGVFRARIVFDFRPIKVDSAHRPVFRDTPGGPRYLPGGSETFGSRGESAISRSRSLLRPVFCPPLRLLLARARAPRDSEKYYLSASWHINSPYAMIIKVSRDTVSGRRSICSGGAVVYTGCSATRALCRDPRRILNQFLFDLQISFPVSIFRFIISFVFSNFYKLCFLDIHLEIVW